jgi:SAM-dependent methyltransferase
MSELDGVRRFNNRVQDYVKYRPSYPDAIVPFLERALGFGPGSQLVDVGAGTGKLTDVLLRAGHRVVAVEPNAGMRQAAEAWLGDRAGFTSLDGSAEQMPLPDASADAIVAGQAFHWFDPIGARIEFMRVLRPSGGAALIWNNRRTDASEFLRELEALLLRTCPDYPRIGNKHYEESALLRFFGGRGPVRACFDSEQRFDFEGLRGRILSSSYAPVEGPAHDALMQGLHDLFERRAAGGQVAYVYDTEVFYGRLD